MGYFIRNGVLFEISAVMQIQAVFLEYCKKSFTFSSQFYRQYATGFCTLWGLSHGRNKLTKYFLVCPWLDRDFYLMVESKHGEFCFDLESVETSDATWMCQRGFFFKFTLLHQIYLNFARLTVRCYGFEVQKMTFVRERTWKLVTS